jgi:hypothetical protein
MPCRCAGYSVQPFTTAFLCLFLLIPKTSASDKSFTDDEAARNVLAGCEEELKAANGAATFDEGRAAVRLGLYASLGSTDGPVLRSCETAERSCAGAKGFLSNMLFGTPWIDHSSGFPPVM